MLVALDLERPSLISPLVCSGTTLTPPPCLHDVYTDALQAGAEQGVKWETDLEKHLPSLIVFFIVKANKISDQIVMFSPVFM